MRPRVFKVNISCSEWNETIAIKSGFANLNMFNEEILVRFPQFAGKQFKIYYNDFADKITVLNAADFQIFLEMRIPKIFLVEEVRRCAIEEVAPADPTIQLESKTRNSATLPQGVKQIEKNTKKTDVLANLTAKFLTYLNDQSKLHFNPSDCLDAATETAAKDPEPTPAKKTDASPPAASTEKTDKPPAQTVVPDNEDNESTIYINDSFDTIETAGSLYSSLETIANESVINSLQPVADAINCGKEPVVLPVLPLPTGTSNNESDCFEKQQDQLKIDGWTIVDSTDLTKKTVEFEIPTITITRSTPIKLPRSSPIDIPINAPADICVSHLDSISSIPNRESTIVGDKSLSSIDDLNCAISLFNTEQNACVASHQPTHPDPVIQDALTKMVSMGYTNENDYLVKILESVGGDIGLAFDIYQPTN